MEQTIGLIIKLFATAVCITAAYLIQKLAVYIKSKLSEQNGKLLDMLITELCKAAEQMYRSGDDSGKKRLEYVKEMIMESGYEITALVEAKIESAVFDINNRIKAVK